MSPVLTPDWVKDAIFYQIFPDRFARGRNMDKTGLHLEPWESPPTVHGFKGGDLFGIEEHLDYLQDLGVTALYLNPITSSASNHRYHTYDYFSIDPLLGGDPAFRKLLDSAHRRNMRVVPDGVFNHASRGMWQFHHVLECGDGSPYIDWFHFNPQYLSREKQWGAYPGSEEARFLQNGIGSYDALGYRAWWNLAALPKLNTSNPMVREYIFKAATHWIEFGADGWRLDVPAEIDDDSFWQEFRHRVKSVNSEAYIVGEVWHESQRWLQGDQFDAVMNYLLTGALMGWLINDHLPDYIFKIGDYHKYLRPLNAIEFANRLDYLLGLYDPEINSVQFNLLDSHDTPRFISTAGGDTTSLLLGWLFLFTFVGTPCIYYGDEIGMSGGPDPDCRGSFRWDEEKWNNELFGYAQFLTRFRSDHSALRRGAFQRLYADRQVLAFSRSNETQTLVVAINASDQTAVVSLPSPSSSRGTPPKLLFSTGGPLKIDCQDGQIRDLKLPPRSGVVIG